MSTLLIDCYDSFTYNIVHAFAELGVELQVELCDKITVNDVLATSFDHIVIGPGPGRPSDAGNLLDIVQHSIRNQPMLGICLGHQAIIEALGGTLTVVPPIHGHASKITHDESDLFIDLPNPVSMTRYHSLAACEADLPSLLKATSWDSNRTIMSVQHIELPVYGVQFHPESILSGENGLRLLANFLKCT